MKGGKYIIELLIGEVFSCTCIGLAPRYPENNYNRDAGYRGVNNFMRYIDGDVYLKDVKKESHPAI